MFLLNAPKEAEAARKFPSGFQTRANFCLPLNCALRLFSVEIVDPFSPTFFLSPLRFLSLSFRSTFFAPYSTHYRVRAVSCMRASTAKLPCWKAELFSHLAAGYSLAWQRTLSGQFSKLYLRSHLIHPSHQTTQHGVPFPHIFYAC